MKGDKRLRSITLEGYFKTRLVVFKGFLVLGEDQCHFSDLKTPLN